MLEYNERDYSSQHLAFCTIIRHTLKLKCRKHHVVKITMKDKSHTLHIIIA